MQCNQPEAGYDTLTNYDNSIIHNVGTAMVSARGSKAGKEIVTMVLLGVKTARKFYWPHTLTHRNLVGC